MTPSFCGHCGAGLVPGVAYCGSCGTPVPVRDTAPGLPPATLPPLPRPPVTQPSFTQPPVLPGRGRRLALIGLALALVLGAAGGAAAYLLSRDDDRRDPSRAQRGEALDVRPVGIDDGISVLGEPGEEWFLPVDEVLPGGTMAPFHYEEGPNERPEMFGFADTVVAHATRFDEGTEESSEVVFGVDATTGELRWQLDSLTTPCQPVHRDRLLLCAGADDAPGVALVDPDDGKVVARHPMAAGRGAEYREDGDTLYVMYRGPGEDLSVTVDAFGLPDLRPLWSTPLDTSVLDCCHGDFVLEVDGLRLVASWINAQWELDRFSGELLVSSDETQLQLLGGYETVYDDDGGGVRIHDPSGREVLWAPGGVWGDPTGVDIVEGRLGIGDSLYNLATGDAVWTSSAFRDETDATWLPDHEGVLVQHWEEESTSLVDARDGTHLVELAGIQGATSVVVTEDAAVATDSSGTLAATRLDDGASAWTRDLSAVSTLDDEYDQHWVGVALSRTAVLAAGEHGLAGFTGFAGSGGRDGAVTDAGDSGDGDSGGGDPAYTTACGSPPEFVPVESAAAYGGVTVTFEVRAVCPGGQWLNLSQLRVPIVVDGYTYADGYFDFGVDPYWIPETGETLQLVYPYEQTQVPAQEIAEAVDSDGGTGEVVAVECEPGPDNTSAPVPSDPALGGDPEDPNSSVGAPDETEGLDTRDETALEALRRIAAEDASAVEALDWTAQLSSKKPGTYDDGMVYDSYDDILALHLRLRAVYPDSLLVLSTDWRGTYSRVSRGYWVTLNGRSDPTTAPVLRWCRREGRGEGDCWAVRVRRSGDPARNADHAPPDDRNN